MKSGALVIALLAVGCMAFGRAAYADSNVTFKNDSGRTLHIYYASAPNGTTINCESLSYGGTFAPGATWSYSVGANRWGWVRFQENTQNNGCSSHNNKSETRIAGSAESRSETVSVQ
jgi:hypothetical protein